MYAIWGMKCLISTGKHKKYNFFGGLVFGPLNVIIFRFGLQSTRMVTDDADDDDADDADVLTTTGYTC